MGVRGGVGVSVKVWGRCGVYVCVGRCGCEGRCWRGVECMGVRGGVRGV